MGRGKGKGVALCLSKREGFVIFVVQLCVTLCGASVNSRCFLGSLFWKQDTPF